MPGLALKLHCVHVVGREQTTNSVNANGDFQTIALLDGKPNRMIPSYHKVGVSNGAIPSPKFGRRYSSEAAGHGPGSWSEP